jgi:hypothetical protein
MCSELDLMRWVAPVQGSSSWARSAVLPRRINQLPWEAAGQLRLPVRAQERQELRAPPPRPARSTAQATYFLCT